jgi:hypothetical protein
MSETKTYEGGCHCGAARFTVKTDLAKLMSCNCSICEKTGTILNFVPRDQFELTAGKDKLTEYQWGKKRIHFFHCAVCGVRPFAESQGRDGTPMTAVNVRCLDGIDLKALTIHEFDGRSL